MNDMREICKLLYKFNYNQQRGKLKLFPLLFRVVRLYYNIYIPRQYPTEQGENIITIKKN